jgi:acetyltransferase-like isoleucine patch superfamily enzyme
MKFKTFIENIITVISSSKTNTPNTSIPKRTKVGADVFIGQNAYIDPYLGGSLITIDDGAMITRGSFIISHDASSYPRTGFTYVAPVRIGKRAYIGMNSIILPGVSIGEDAIIGAGSVVTRDVDAGTVVAGNPAKVIGNTEVVDKKRDAYLDSMIDLSNDPWNLTEKEISETENLAKNGPFLVRRKGSRPKKE